MKKLLLLAVMALLVSACDDEFFPFHDEGWHGRGHYEHGRGHYEHGGHEGRD